LPAQQGDAVWVEYGDRSHPHRFLIDAGTPPTAHAVKKRIEAVPTTDRKLELLIVTHIDTDHIGGVLRLLSDPGVDVRFEDVWFNAWRHLNAAGDQPLGPIDGEILDQLLASGAGGKVLAWNKAFNDAAIVVPKDGALPTKTLPGGMTLTLLAPGPRQLARLRRKWAEVIRDTQISDAEREAMIVSGAAHRGVDLPLGTRPDVRSAADQPFETDDAPANGSSIVVLAEFEGTSVLLTGDGFAPVIEAGVRRLIAERAVQRLRLDAVKLAHHGSQNNTSRSLLELLDARRFLVSSNGAIFHHPDVEAISRVLVTQGAGVELDFNYRTERTELWDDPTLQTPAEFDYTAVYGAAEKGLRVEL
jgi:hypothetical protein